jgi:hypothetical protein
MKLAGLLALSYLASFGPLSAQAGEPKGILEVLPAVTELGQGWTTNLVTYLYDRYSRPSEISYGEDPGNSRFLHWLRTSLQKDNSSADCLAGRTGYCLAHYGLGDLVFNSGEYQICVMRWSDRRSLHNSWVDWKMSRCRVVRDGVAVGEDFYWSEDLTAQTLTLRRGLFTVSVTAGLRSDYRPMVHLSEAIDAKIRGRSVPKLRPASAGDNHE